VHADDRDRVREALFDAVRHLAPFEYDHRVVRPDGDVRVLHTVGAGVGDQGSPRRLVGSCWDVTVHHATTERLRHSVSLLEATLDATADGILVVDAERRVTAHNRRFLEMWRVPASLASGSDNVLLSRVSELLEDPAGFREGVRQLYDAPAREGFDVLRFKDGRVFERYSRPQRIGSRIVGRVWSFRDVSEREHLVQRSTFLADAARLLASLDADKALQDVARLAVPYLGRQCIIDVQRDGTWHRLFGAPEDGSPVPPPDLHPRVADGHSIRYAAGSRSIVAVPLLSRDAVIGAITAVAGPGRIYDGKDLTLLEELASRMALSLDNARLFEGARHAVASRDEFLSIAAHEIRGPLTSIHLAVQALLRNSLSGDGARAALETIQREDRRVGRFVDDLLDLGRMRSGQLHLALEEVDLGTIVRDVISHLAGDFAQAGSDATVTTSGELVGHWDPVRLEQVVTNLVSNAIKFGEGKPIDVTAEGAHGRARLRVTDHGIGIAADRLARIFDRFERAVDARHYGGLGLGLHIAKTIVNGLGGTLTVESQPGCGSTFTVELPLVREEER
jgi:signal transduction histidine kinase